jgi:hypothetical protein
MLTIITVLLGRRVLKGVTDDDKRDAAAGWQLSSRSSRRAGTKRRRVIKSGADDMLELEGAEEDENEEGDLRDKGHHRGHRLSEWWFIPSRSPGNEHRQQKRPRSPVFRSSIPSDGTFAAACSQRHATMIWGTTKKRHREKV